ncbi:hypothetical protein J8273_5095 [Carpediemonas membranifera]|uniref:Uncharacterized protein n=1 Tax=Carpediemonas membranifera TaxID=201153 RepID=A0A8J6AR25_9EUKA|nr:hypothetical protein J8273_5095 [Carpediemonas membranifera]|eukprot:KAG9392116.1 hypothetical protein J8273_5095 [Carpediemonas membranifera]
MEYADGDVYESVLAAADESNYSDMMPSDLDPDDSVMEDGLASEHAFTVEKRLTSERIRREVNDFQNQELIDEARRERDKQREINISNREQEWLARATSDIMGRKEYFSFVEKDKQRKIADGREKARITISIKEKLDKQAAIRQREIDEHRAATVVAADKDYYQRQASHCLEIARAKVVADIKREEVFAAEHKAAYEARTEQKREEYRRRREAKELNERRELAAVKREEATIARRESEWAEWKERNADKKPFFRVAGGATVSL